MSAVVAPLLSRTWLLADGTTFTVYYWRGPLLKITPPRPKS